MPANSEDVLPEKEENSVYLHCQLEIITPCTFRQLCWREGEKKNGLEGARENGKKLKQRKPMRESALTSSE